MNDWKLRGACTGSLCLMAWGCEGAETLTVSAVNRLDLVRPSQTIELSAAQLAPLNARSLDLIHVQSSAGEELLCQAVDTDGDPYRKPDTVIFQADFAPGETKHFTVTVAGKQVYSGDQFQAFGRFNRERFDDFAWENDRIAHRTYGKALETWDGEPLTSSTVDIWSKRSPRMVINDWYLADDYHVDHGEGADFYSAGLSRGCGGNGLWAGDRLWTSRNFVNSRVLASGPVRVLFELEYEPFEVEGISVSETKLIALDAGSQLNRITSTYRQFTRPGRTQSLVMGIGLKKVSGEQLDLNSERGWLAKWEAMEKNAGEQGLGIVFDPASFDRHTEDQLNQLILVRVPADQQMTYWAGFCWNKAGHITSAEAWKQYLDTFTRGLESPIAIRIQEAGRP